MKKHTFNKHDKDLTSHSKKDHGKSTDRIPVRVYNTSNAVATYLTLLQNSRIMSTITL
ncbi:hypothetical protein PHYBLDRAFT_156966 [Phycomyces blakesleeanus NRRL 1555(-)]|uniref:Uncharacterized protein n=1 Tax=Phycomyces blakesleeanus (strain ATCC 8743b / DSM 1359 / FGSC 10004 / NBRC 33097 / NRRL 1555) TaxID=763407 RepID=A0A162YHJ3_PHYB8|nr:hypothetical protein PHYBLDRAFT_156966 [Phycomyces blakesleeanus NRRL 1555(-)]OAD80735.1 hypothetical protein PHYBLDRAFT_156966 [Phycomyces blakesleeanus NRRL 1555(-)]|eukprot:XP_018298775.1 hypothetical protein PHYBLDRAFT_156966 [Phycomyces blakesleeanus NRRL 1555(-)]